MHDFVTKLNDKDLSTILGVIGARNFEVIMQYLDNFSALVSAFGGDPALKKRVDAASAKLKTSLLDAVKALHPEHVFKVPEEQSKACARFLKTFLDSGGNIYSTNYDLLLYWVLMRNSIVEHVDGCGRELENPSDQFVPPEEQIWSDLTWGRYRDKQNVLYAYRANRLIRQELQSGQLGKTTVSVYRAFDAFTLPNTIAFAGLSFQLA